jgi:F-type H+-transporting ATPase subunit epsilon
MAMTIHVDIVSAEREIFSGLAEMVFAPAIMGEVGIAPRHAPLITNLAPGEVRVKLPDGGGEEAFYVSGGVLEVQPHVVTVLSDTAMRAEDLDEAAVFKAKEEAERQLHDREAEIDYATALAQHAELAAQLQAIQRLRKRTGRS